jgi:hypothetical protein
VVRVTVVGMLRVAVNLAALAVNLAALAVNLAALAVNLAALAVNLAALAGRGLVLMLDEVRLQVSERVLEPSVLRMHLDQRLVTADRVLKAGEPGACREVRRG